MNFWVLWDNYPKVKENWSETKDLAYSIIQFINHKIEIEKAYSSGLQHLSKLPLFDKGKNTLIPSLSKLQTYCTQKSLSLSQLIEEQQADIIAPLRALLSEQEEIVRTKARYAGDFSAGLEKHKLQCEKAKDSYFSICDHSEVSSKSENAAAKNYIKSIEESNKFLEVFEENMKQILAIFYQQEQQKLGTLKDSLRKFVVYEIGCLRAYQYELDLLPIAVDAFSPEVELKKFVSDVTSGKEFTKLSVEIHPKRRSTQYGVNMFGRQQVEILDGVIEKCWKSVVISDIDNKSFNEIICLAEGRKMWIQRLTEKMNQQAFLIPSCTFGILCGLTTTLLDRVLEYRDIYCAKQIIYISQYFYEETLSHRTYMHELLLTHQLWEDYKLWGQLIIASVDSEIESDAKICAEDVNSLNQTMKLRPVLCNKISSYIQQMKNFMLDTDTIEKVLKLIQEYYRINIDVIKIAN